MPTTPNLALPYPVLADTADVPRDIQALAVALDGITAIRPPVVTALPGSPADGQEVYLQTAVMATEGVMWHLRYRTGLAKWEFLGGGPLANEVSGAGTTATTGSYVDLASSVGPTVTIPVAGVYEVTFAALLTTAAVATNYAAMDILGPGRAAQDSTAAWINTPAAGAVNATQLRVILATFTGAGDIVCKYKTGGAAGTITAQRRWMTVRPVRLG